MTPAARAHRHGAYHGSPQGRAAGQRQRSAASGAQRLQDRDLRPRRRGMNAFTFRDEPLTEARPYGHGRGSQPIEWPEPIDILADPQLTRVASVDATCLPQSILA